jgi:hypothetical protein
MTAIALYRSLMLSPPSRKLSPTQEKVKIVLLFVNIALGIIVLMLSGLMVSLAA